MTHPEKPDRRLQSSESQRQQAAASRETSRAADSVPVVSGQFANLPATFGRYQVERLLGRGAMGAVYLARDMQLDRLVALKIPKVTASGSKKLLLRLETEAKAAAQLDHPSLCKVHDAGEINGQCFIAMQYIEGETLKDQIEVKSKTVAEAVSLILQLAEGLSEAHALGIIHRDLKPENIMVNRRGLPVIMDFGLAKFSTISSNAKATQAGTILGSPAYMSPEQASGNVKEVDQRSDLYALGTIFFELLTGELPFTGSAMQILGQKSILDPASPLSLKPHLPPQVATLCHKMIARNSVDRYQTLKEVIHDLQRMDAIGAMPIPGPLTEQSVAFPDFSALVQSDELNASNANKKRGKPAKRSSKSPAATATLPQQLRAWWNGRPPAIKWTALGGAAFVFLCGVIIITITNGEGQPKRIVVPSSSTVTITQGEVDEKPSLESQATDPRIAKSGWQGWPADAPLPAIAPFDATQASAHQAAWAKYLGVPVEYNNTIGMKFVLIPPGEFTMGSSAAEIEASREGIRPDDTAWLELLKTAGPEHKVILTQPIYLGVTEVTQSEYQKVMGQNPSIFASTGAGKAAVAGMETTTHPVEMVSWNDAAEFCAKLSLQEQFKPFYTRAGETVTQLEGTGYRLPTEAEWEFACRAGTVTKSWIGDQKEDLVQAAWIDSNSGWRTHAVGELKANPFGLSDILGNLCEWVQDGWDPTYYAGFREKVAINPVNPFGASIMRTARGGGWNGVASICRSACRNPSYGGALDGTGFRVSLTVDAVKTTDRKGTGPTAAKNEPVPVAPATTLPETQPPQATSTASPLVSARKAGQEWSANGPKIHFCWCPPGKFTMGSARSEPGRLANEDPLKVTLSRGFWLGKTEVTRGQWLTVMGSEPRNVPPSVGQSELHPVQSVVRGDHRAGPLEKNIAMEFCERLTEQERTAGRLPDEWRYDLPTEAQWEYACRAGTKSAYSFANNSSRLNEYAWWGASVGNGDVKTGPRPVGGKRANSWGLHDMHGNVWELCSDRYSDNRKRYSKESDPIGPQSGDYWVVRGGSWFTNAEGCRSASRKPGENGQVAESLIGFRVALVSAGPSVDPSAATNTGKNRPIPVLPSAKPALAHSEAAPPKGFVALFNGKDLAGWRGGTTEHPLMRQALTPEERVSKDKASIADIHKHWRVENGELINDGTGLFLTTANDYGDFELRLEYKTVAKADSGIYLRGFPQVQIWDYTQAGGKFDRHADKGSGGLYNNPEGSPGQLPLILADKPFGEWNSFRITMVGDRVSVTLNEKLVVDNATLHNYFAKDQPLLSAGPIQLQTHGGEIRWRNIFLREINRELPEKEQGG